MLELTVKYFKNTELAKLYHVSEKSIRNWVQAAVDGKLDLQLHTEKGKSFVANTAANNFILDRLAQKGKKYKNTRSFRVVSPKPELYKLYKQTQILEIISNLTIHSEIPTQYSYADGGAKYWDQYATRLYNAQSSNILNSTIELLDETAATIDHLVKDRSKINVVDLGPGNGLPIRSTLKRLLAQDKLKRYIAIDGSKDILRIAEQNIDQWFNGKVQFEGYVRDFSFERFDDLLANEYIGENADAPANLVFLLGNTLNNFRSPNQTLQTVNSSLGLYDLLLVSTDLDTPNSRRYFDFNVSRSNQKLRSELMLGFLGIDESLYEIEQVFDPERHTRSVNFRPTVDLTIKFELTNGPRYVELRKDEPVLLWRSWHKSATTMIEQFNHNGFDVVQGTKSKNQEYILLAAKVSTNHSI